MSPRNSTSCPFHFGLLSPLFSLFCSLPGNILYCTVLSNIAGGGLVSLQRFHSSNPPFQDTGFKLFQHTPGASAVAADQKRSQPRWPFGRALRDVFQWEASNHGSCPFTWHQFRTEPEVCPLGRRIIWMCWPFCLQWLWSLNIARGLVLFFLPLFIWPLNSSSWVVDSPKIVTYYSAQFSFDGAQVQTKKDYFSIAPFFFCIPPKLFMMIWSCWRSLMERASVKKNKIIK